MLRPKASVGILGGSFNPVHCGHMMLAQYIAEFTGLDEVWLSLSPENPLKAEGGDSMQEMHRMRMLEFACAEAPRVRPVDIELSLPRPSYTALYLKQLRENYNDTIFSLIIGSDNWLIFNKWRDYSDILIKHSLLIYPRPGYEINPASLPENAIYLEKAPISNLSSTFIRKSISEGKCINQFLPAGVYQYIESHNLYK